MYFNFDLSDYRDDGDVRFVDNFFARAWASSKRFQAEVSGATAVEYALLAGSLALAIIVGVTMMGESAVNLLSVPTDAFNEASE